MKQHHLLFLLGVAWGQAAYAQLLPETTMATLRIGTELTYRDDIRALANASEAERWKLPWPPGFTEKWREHKDGSDLVLRWTHVTACVQPAEPKEAGPCPGTYSVALEMHMPRSLRPPLKDDDIDFSSGSDYCVDAGTLSGATRIAGEARDGSADCLGVLKGGCVHFGNGNLLKVDLHFVAASVTEPLQACPDLRATERLTYSFSR